MARAAWGVSQKNLSFCNSVTARSIVLKFEMHLGAHKLQLMQ